MSALELREVPLTATFSVRCGHHEVAPRDPHLPAEFVDEGEVIPASGARREEGERSGSTRRMPARSEARIVCAGERRLDPCGENTYQ